MQFTTRRLMVIVLIVALDLAILRADLLMGAWAVTMTVLIAFAILSARKRLRPRRPRNPLWRFAVFLVVLVLTIAATVGVTIGIARIAMRHVAF